MEHNDLIPGELYQHLHSSKIIVMYIGEPSDSEVEKWYYIRGCAKVLYGDRITFAQKSNLRKCNCQND